MDGRVVVVGSINFDVITRASHLPVKGETLIGAELNLSTGGKGANQAVAAHRLGAPTTLHAAVGVDVFAREVIQFLESEGITLRIVRKNDMRTGLAQVLVADDGQNAVVVASGANAGLVVADVTDISITERDVVLLQNEIPPATSDFIVELARSSGATVVLNLAPYRPVGPEILALVDYLVVNEFEFWQLHARGTHPQVDLIPQIVGESHGPSESIIVTVGPYGAVANLGGTTSYVGGHVVPVRDTTGAGDCFCGAFAAAIASGYNDREALEFANAAAAVSVQVSGTSTAMPSLDDCFEMLGREGEYVHTRRLTW